MDNKLYLGGEKYNSGQANCTAVHKCARCGSKDVASTGYEAFKAGTFRFYVCGRCGDKDYDILDELHGQLGLFDTPAQHGPDQLITLDEETK